MVANICGKTDLEILQLTIFVKGGLPRNHSSLTILVIYGIIKELGLFSCWVMFFVCLQSTYTLTEA